MRSYTPDSITASVHLLERQLTHVLDRDSDRVLEQMLSSVEETPGRWTCRIHPDNPLRFIPCPKGGLEIQPDIHCKISGTTGQNATLVEQNVVIRVWSLTDSLSFREAWDAPSLATPIGDQAHHRVVSRFHYDFANPGQEGPQNHLQVGGKAETNEYCWFPEVVDVPRIAHPPIDLILACETVLANFYPVEFRRLIRQPEWNAMVRRSEVAFLSGYYERCRSLIRRASGLATAGTLLSNLWTPQV